MVCLALIVSCTMAGVLLWAGLEKGRTLDLSTSTILALGVPLRQARPVAMVLILAEICVGFGLLFWPDRVLTQTGVVALALVFALAGIIALSRGKSIHCNCFGWGSSGRLGRSQIVALLPWFVGVALLRLALTEPLRLSAGAARLCGVGLTLASFRAITVWRARREARGDRLCAIEMYLWPR
jgi:hypothetical protein